MRWHSVVIPALAVTGAIFVGLWNSQMVAGWKTFSDPTTRIVIEYPPDLINQPITDTDRQDKIIFRGTEKPGDRPVLITLRYEDGLRVTTELAKKDLLDLLVENSDRAHPDRFPEYQKISERRLDLAGKKAAEILFTYKRPAGERIKQRFLIVVRDNDLAVYLAAQTQEADFAVLDQKYFDRLFSAVRFDE